MRCFHFRVLLCLSDESSLSVSCWGCVFVWFVCLPPPPPLSAIKVDIIIISVFRRNPFFFSFFFLTLIGVNCKLDRSETSMKTFNKYSRRAEQ